MYKLLLLPILALLGCGDNSPKRADLTEWKTLNLKQFGLRIDVPKDEYHLTDRDGSMALIELHSRSSGIGDAYWFIKISIDRYHKNEYAEVFKTKSQLDDWLKWMNTPHLKPSKMQTELDTQFRFDLIGEKHIHSFHCKYTSRHFSKQEAKEDIEAISRIFNSARSL